MEICRGIIVKSPKCVKTVGCEFKSYLEAIKETTTVIVVYDPDNPRCEREAAAVAVAENAEQAIHHTRSQVHQSFLI